jgi:hypothetical protein
LIRTTEFLLDGATVLGVVDTGALAPGASTVVSVQRNTAHAANGDHTLTVTADHTGAVAESSESNNSRSGTVSILGNKVPNSSFENDADGDGTPRGARRCRPFEPGTAYPPWKWISGGSTRQRCTAGR